MELIGSDRMTPDERALQVILQLKLTYGQSTSNERADVQKLKEKIRMYKLSTSFMMNSAKIKPFDDELMQVELEAIMSLREIFGHDEEALIADDEVRFLRGLVEAHPSGHILERPADQPSLTVRAGKAVLNRPPPVRQRKVPIVGQRAKGHLSMPSRETKGESDHLPTAAATHPPSSIPEQEIDGSSQAATTDPGWTEGAADESAASARSVSISLGADELRELSQCTNLTDEALRHFIRSAIGNNIFIHIQRQNGSVFLLRELDEKGRPKSSILRKINFA